MAVVLTTSFRDLLEQAGAHAARFGRKWHCPHCPKNSSPTLSVGGEVFYCFRCGWKGNQRTLERDSGAPVRRPSPAERQEKNLLGAETERFLSWWRWRWGFYRDLNWALQEIERDALSVKQDAEAAGKPIPTWVFASSNWAMRKQKELWHEVCRLSDPERNFTFLFAEYQKSRGGWKWA